VAFQTLALQHQSITQAAERDQIERKNPRAKIEQKAAASQRIEDAENGGRKGRGEQAPGDRVHIRSVHRRIDVILFVRFQTIALGSFGDDRSSLIEYAECL